MAREATPISWREVAEKLAAALPRERLHPAVAAWTDAARASSRRWGIAFSGGADSLAVLLLVWAHWPERREGLVALHFNHRLRGRAAEADMAFCREVAAGLGIDVETGEWTEPPEQASEAQAREARYTFFREQLLRHDADGLWLGHQQDDIAETQFMRLARGSGTGGLAAPRPVQTVAGEAVRLRPLLTVRKSEVIRGLTAAGGIWREDATNGEDAFFRNRLRSGVLPVWEAAAGRDAVAGAALSRERLEEDDEALEQWLDDLAPFSEEGNLLLDRLAGRPLALWRRALHRWLLRHPHGSDLSRHGFEDLLSKARSGRTTRFSLGARGFARIASSRLTYESE